MMRSHIALALLVVAFAAPDATATEIPYKRFLVPLYAHPAAGAFGSVWGVDTWFQNSGTVTFEIIPRWAVCAVMCPDPQPGRIVRPGDLLPLQPVVPRESGVLVHIPPEHVSAITFQSRVRDLSRDADSAGTEVPIVPENEFMAGPLHLLNVPIAPHMRATLRIYALPEFSSPEVEVRYFGMFRTDILRSERVKLRTYPATEGILLHPSFAAVANFETLPEIIGQEAVWIEVVPVTEGLPIWAFVSVTNNTTQQVTLVTPSRK